MHYAWKIVNKCTKTVTEAQGYIITTKFVTWIGNANRSDISHERKSTYFWKIQKVGSRGIRWASKSKKAKNLDQIWPIHVNFWPTYLNTVPFIFGWSKSLAFFNLEVHGVPQGSLFWNFKKCKFLRPWRTSDGFHCLSKSQWRILWPIFLKIGKSDIKTSICRFVTM